MDEQLGPHVPALKRYALGLTGEPGAAEDLVHDCIARALGAGHQWRGRNLRAWLFTIMTNLYRNGARTRARRGPTVVFDETVHAVTEPGEPDPMLEDRLVAALDTLNPDMRAVLMLVVLEGCTYEEAAGILSIPPGTVMSRLSRARRQLARILAQDNIVSLKDG